MDSEGCFPKTGVADGGLETLKLPLNDPPFGALVGSELMVEDGLETGCDTGSDGSVEEIVGFCVGFSLGAFVGYDVADVGCSDVVSSSVGAAVG